MRKNCLVCPPRSLDMFLAFWTNFWPNFDQNGPNLTFYIQNANIFCKIHTQGLKLCGKLVLFDSLGLLIGIWPFGPIWTKFEPLRAKISKWGRETPPQNLTMNFIHKKLLKNNPSCVGGVFLIFGLGWILPEPAVSSEKPFWYVLIIKKNGI